MFIIFLRFFVTLSLLAWVAPPIANGGDFDQGCDSARHQEIQVAIITGDREKLVEIVGEYADLFEFGSEIMADILDVYAGQPPYEQGKMFGGAIFEIASFIIPAAKAGSLANIAKATAMASIIEKIRAAAWFAKMPEAGKAKVIGALDKLSAFVAKLATTKMCFVAGTPIQTADGLRAIETITPGDSVWSRNPETGDMAYRPVISATVTHPTTLHHIVYRAGNARRVHAVGAASAVANGEDSGSDDPPGSTNELICTGEHPFFVQEKQRFVEAGSLQVGDSLMLADRTTATVVSNTTEAAPDGHTFTTYNFEVAEFHTYFANVGGVWVHNAGRDCERIFTLYEKLKQRGATPQEAFGKLAKLLPDTVKNREAIGTALSEAIKTDVLPNRVTPIWTKGPEANPGANAWRHFNDHGAEVGAVDAITFVQKAITFSDQAVGANVGVLKIGKRVKNGVEEMVYMNLNTGEFAVKVVSGAESGGLKTFFVRQNNRAKYFTDQLVGGGLELQ